MHEYSEKSHFPPQISLFSHLHCPLFLPELLPSGPPDSHQISVCFFHNLPNAITFPILSGQKTFILQGFGQSFYRSF